MKKDLDYLDDEDKKIVSQYIKDDDYMSKTGRKKGVGKTNNAPVRVTKG